MNIILGITGSVATIKTDKVYEELKKVGEVKVVATPSSLKILNTSTILPFKLITEEDEWEWKVKGDDVLHVSLSDWADILVIAPLSANTLAKLANGICDNLLTCIYRCFDINKPVVLAPAMNTKMWEHPITEKHIQKLEEYHNFRIHTPKCVIVNPIKKELACGTVGIGAMAFAADIAKAVIKAGEIK